MNAQCEVSQRLLCKQYLRKGDGYTTCEFCEQKHESLDEMFDRISFGKAEYREVLSAFDFLPNSPTIFNADGEGTLSACFKFDVQDTMESILDVGSKSALVQKWGGGVGYCFSELRPKGALIRSTHGKACGLIAVMRMYQAVTEMITQGGKREGAQMAVLHCDHADIEEFIHCKDVEGVFNTFNISVAATDEFMRLAVEGRKRERLLFNEIVKGAWGKGDPGLFFIDTAERANPTPHLGKLSGTNPCIAEHQLVLTKRGWVAIEDIVVEDEVLGHDEQYHKVLKVIPQGSKETVDVVLRTGKIIRCTPYHTFLVDGEKVVARDLKKVEPLNRPIVLEAQNIVLKEHLKGYLDGKIYGDGTVGDRVGFCGSVKEVVEEVAQLLNVEFGCNVTVRPGREGVSGSMIWRTMTGQSKAVKYYRGFDICKVKNMPLSYQSGFLRGWFNTDGHYENNNGMECINLTIGERNTVGIQEIWYILQNFGIPPKIYYVVRKGHPNDKKYGFKNPANSFRVQISGKYYNVLADLIGWSRKESRSYDILPLIDVLEIKPSGSGVVYDLTIEGSHSFVVEGIKVSNCGEVPLLDNESCNLGSINLSHFVKRVSEEFPGARAVIDAAPVPSGLKPSDEYFDWSRLKDVARLGVRYLDRVIEENFYPVPEIREATLKTRKLGLGVMGWADALALMRIPYDSQEAVDLAGEIMKTIQEASHDESKKLANEKGCCTALLEEEVPSVRNVCLTCIAPTGSISTLANCSSGIEPHYSLEYTQNMGDGTKLKRKSDFGDFIPKTAHEIGYEWHIKHQAAFQKYVDLAVSKTINMPNSATLEDVAGAYVLAWKSGCKGVTVYREGSRVKQALEIPTPDITERTFPEDDYTALVHKFKVGDLRVWLHWGLKKDGMPGEIFVTASKQGSTVDGLLDAVAILMSIALQSGVPLEELVDKMRGRRFEPSGLTSNPKIPTASSILDYVARYAQIRFLGAHTSYNSGMVCPECGATVISQSGCLVCAENCGWSRC